MLSFQAMYYDGHSSQAYQLQIDINDNGMLSSPGKEFAVHINQLDIRPRIGNTPRKIYLPDSAYLESHDNDSIDKLCQHWQLKNPEHRAHFLESNLRFVWFSLFALITIGFCTVQYGVPAMSKQIAHWLPIEVDRALGKNVLAELDKIYFKPTELAKAQQKDILELFDSLTAIEQTTHSEELQRYTLVFRKSPAIGANAFALPDGTIIMTDELVELVDNIDELSGILLHEIGHIKHRHSLQTLISQSSVSALIVLVSGDVSAASSFVLLLPSIMLQAKFSRQFETESDDYALQQMQALNIPTETFSTTMEKLMAIYNDTKSNSTSDKKTDTTDKILNYFSTHPPTQERIDRFREAGNTQGLNKEQHAQ